MDLPLNSFGVKIGSGVSTIAIKPYNEWDVSFIDDEVVMILTSDNQKQGFYEELFKNSNVEIEDLIDIKRKNELRFEEEEYDEFFDSLERYEDENDISIFFMTKLNHIKDREKLSKTIDEITKNLNFPIDDKYWMESIPSEEIINEEYKTSSELFNKLVSSIEWSFKVANDFFSGSKVYIDLHPEQFLEYKGKIFCIDPILLD
jgi:hypothetical protein